MAKTAQGTIKKAAQAYITGDAGKLGDQLDSQVRMLGSHVRDDWTNRRDAINDLLPELRRHQIAAQTAKGVPAGSLVTQALAPTGVIQSGSTARWTGRGTLNIDGVKYPDASWTVMLEERKGNWRIVHSHFSIHR